MLDSWVWCKQANKQKRIIIGLLGLGCIIECCSVTWGEWMNHPEWITFTAVSHQMAQFNTIIFSLNFSLCAFLEQDSRQCDTFTASRVKCRNRGKQLHLAWLSAPKEETSPSVVSTPNLVRHVHLNTQVWLLFSAEIAVVMHVWMCTWVRAYVTASTSRFNY